MNFIGQKCVHCGNVFDEKDSVVVCPDCGSPHHRDCYKELGRCANESLHAEKFRWKREEEKKEEKESVCRICGTSNIPGGKFCSECGSPLEYSFESENTDQSSSEDRIRRILEDMPKYVGFDPEEDLGGATVKEVSDFVGPNTMYYLPLFKRMKDFGAKFSFNISCLFFPSLYFANRKMWGWAIIVTIVSLILGIPTALLYFAESDGIPETLLLFIQQHSVFLEKADAVTSTLDFFLNILLCFIGNRLYYKYVMRSVKKIKSRNDGFTKQKIAQLGGVKPVNMIIITFIKLGIAFLFGMVATAIPGMFAMLEDFSAAMFF